MIKKRPDQYLIGLTGNIGTGKSVVRRMLEHLGFFGIDADVLGHHAMKADSEGYFRVMEEFGKDILNEVGEIDRKKLGGIVFSSKDQLEKLEKIIHPLVIQSINTLIAKSSFSNIVIEAIKLFESGIASRCDSVWVTYTPEEVQIERLINLRKMELEDAKLRVSIQPPQEEKMENADVVIQTGRTMENTWEQVLAAWKSAIEKNSSKSQLEKEPFVSPPGGRKIIRANPSHWDDIATFLTKWGSERYNLEQEDVIKILGEKAILFIMDDGRIVGLVEFKLMHFAAILSVIVIRPGIKSAEVAECLVVELEKISRGFQCEVVMVESPGMIPGGMTFLDTQGYRKYRLEELVDPAWRVIAASTLKGKDENIFMKILDTSV